MSDLITRVQLHGATRSEYDLLAEALARDRVTNIIIIRNTRYHLPSGVYCFCSATTLRNTIKKVARATDSMGLSYAAFVSRRGNHWLGPI